MKSMLASVFFLLCYFSQGCCLFVEPMMLKGRVSGMVSMTCVLTETPMDCSNINWRGPALTSDPSSPRIVITAPFGVTLTINDLRIEDQGQYSCACGNDESMSVLLEVNSLPDFRYLDHNQSFERGDSAIIRCNVTRGDPPLYPIWMRDGRTISNTNRDGRYIIQPDPLSLLVEDIRDEDAGIFTCGFNSVAGYKYEEISVTVTEPRNPGFVIVQPTERNVFIDFGEPLTLQCSVDVDQASVNISWILRDQTQVFNSTLVLQPEEVMSGYYRCFAYNSVNERHKTVFVTVNAKPTFSRERMINTLVVKSSQGSRLEQLEQTLTRAPVVGGHLNVQWKRKDSNAIVDFGSRHEITWIEHEIRWIIKDAQLEDDGEYFMNISNEFGHTVLSTRLVVSAIEMITVQVQISGQNCQLLKDNKDELGMDIARAYSICTTFCEDIHPADVDCMQNADAVVSLSIPREYWSEQVVNITFNLSGHSSFLGMVSMAPTPTFATPDPPVTQTSENDIIIICVVLAVILTVSMIVLLVTIFIWKFSRSHCKKHRVAEVDPEDPPVDMENVECSGYMKVNRNAPGIARPAPVTPSVTTTATPVTAPFPSSLQLHLPHQPPSPTPITRACRASTRTHGGRPTKLFARSQSYHDYSYSGRTRTPPDVRSTRERM